MTALYGWHLSGRRPRAMRPAWSGAVDESCCQRNTARQPTRRNPPGKISRPRLVLAMPSGAERQGIARKTHPQRRTPKKLPWSAGLGSLTLTDDICTSASADRRPEKLSRLVRREMLRNCPDDCCLFSIKTPPNPPPPLLWARHGGATAKFSQMRDVLSECRLMTPSHLDSGT